MQVPSALLHAAGSMHSGLVLTQTQKSASTESAFSGIFDQAIAAVQQQQDESSAKINGFLSGDGTDVHTVMIASQKASLAFDMALTLRNKAVGAYQQLMSMQF